MLNGRILDIHYTSKKLQFLLLFVYNNSAYQCNLFSSVLSKLQLIMVAKLSRLAATRIAACLLKLQIICASSVDANQLMYGVDNKGSSLNDQLCFKYYIVVLL